MVRTSPTEIVESRFTEFRFRTRCEIAKKLSFMISLSDSTRDEIGCLVNEVHLECTRGYEISDFHLNFKFFFFEINFFSGISVMSHPVVLLIFGLNFETIVLLGNFEQKPLHSI